jgi:transposase-like protein
MSFLKRLLGRKEAPPPREAEVSEPVCPHVALVPRWDNADDMGKSEMVSSYVCEACKASFSREEGERLQAEGVERVRLLNVERLKKQ